MKNNPIVKKRYISHKGISNTFGYSFTSKKKGKADVPFTKKVPPPRKSQFSHDQQRRYVYLYKKYSHKTTIDTTEEEKVEIRELQVDSEIHR